MPDALPPEPRSEPALADELATIPDEPLLPVEKQLIGWSLFLGVALLGLLYYASQAFFPVPEAGGADGGAAAGPP